LIKGEHPAALLYDLIFQSTQHCACLTILVHKMLCGRVQPYKTTEKKPDYKDSKAVVIMHGGVVSADE
jgi:hypothetical protein